MNRSDLSAERIARNQATFREANEGIGRAAQAYEADGRVPFICECSDPSCSEVISLELAAYEAVRSAPTHFICAVGHHRTAAPWGNMLEERDGYEIVEKVGAAADVAEELDPRSG